MRSWPNLSNDSIDLFSKVNDIKAAYTGLTNSTEFSDNTIIWIQIAFLDRLIIRKATKKKNKNIHTNQPEENYRFVIYEKHNLIRMNWKFFDDVISNDKRRRFGFDDEWAPIFWWKVKSSTAFRNQTFGFCWIQENSFVNARLITCLQMMYGSLFTWKWVSWLDNHFSLKNLIFLHISLNKSSKFSIQ